MRKYAFILCILTIFVANDVKGNTIPASVAASKPPIPTFDDIHNAYTRIVGNESGWVNDADANGILQVLLRGGGGRVPGRKCRGCGYGINYFKFMRMMANFKRTFPADSPWLGYTTEAQKKRHRLRQARSKGNSLWTSGLTLDCQEPKNWPLFTRGMTDHVSWLGFDDRCKALFKRTKEFLKGKRENWCRDSAQRTVRPQFWGGKMDVPKKEWEELTCNKPGTDCSKYNPNSRHCSRNYWWQYPLTVKTEK